MQKSVKWLQLFVEMKLCTLYVFGWFKRLREGHEVLEDDARWAAVTWPKSGNNYERYKLLVRDHQMTQKLMEDHLGINEMSQQTSRRSGKEEHTRSDN